MTENNRSRPQAVNHNTSYKQKRTDKQQIFLAKLLLFLIAFAVIMVITIICIGCKHNQKDPELQTNANITVDNGDSKTNVEVPLSSFLINDTLYINFSEFALKCNMTITGSETVQTFSVLNGENTEYMTVTSDSVIAQINGVNVQMPFKAILKGNEMWLCIDFVSNTVNGVQVSYDKQTNTLTCKRKELNASTPSNPLYEKISFTHNVTEPQHTVTIPSGIDTDTQTTPETTAPTTTNKSPYDFKVDLSKYEEYMEPSNRDGYLVIANRNILLDEDYVPKDLTKVYKAPGSADKYKMSYVAAMAFEAMVKESEAYGLNIYPCSGYRSYNTQKYLFQNYVNGHIKNDGMTYDEAVAYASTYSMVAGASEHQTGLTMDVNWTETTFGSTKEAKWLVENSYKFGFVIRYPADKEDITGISWEPWHLRFVGRYHAQRMTKLNMCLEEYLDYIKTNS